MQYAPYRDLITLMCSIKKGSIKKAVGGLLSGAPLLFGVGATHTDAFYS